MINFGTKTVVIEANYNEFESLIREQYGKEFDFVDDQEANNDSQHTFLINGKDKYAKAEVSRWQFDGEEANHLSGYLLEDLCARGLIEPGTYLINVCW